MSKPVSISVHIIELRSRLLKSIFTWLIASVTCLFFSAELWELLMHPIQDLPVVQIVNLSPAEGVLADLTACALAGFLLASPFILYQIHRFITPALRHHEKRIALPWFWCAWLLFVMGMALAWWLLLPLLLTFFSSYNAGIAVQQWTQMSYVGFLLRICITLGLYFELPAVVWLLARWKIISPTLLIRHARIAILAIFVLAALSTPPDAFSMFLMAAPMLAVYGFSVLVAYWTYPREAK